MVEVGHDVGFVEVAERVWLARHSWYDVNVTVIGGERGLVVVDTHASQAAGRRLVEDLRRQVGTEVVAVVNTHDHLDHVLGNAALREAFPDVALVAHQDAAAALAAYAGGEGTQDDLDAEMVASVPVVPETTFSSVHVVDLGDRAVELVHPGRGHTAGDLVVRVEGADVLVAGDLVEESGVPAFGPDSHPMSWPLSLDLVLGLVGEQTLVVPGHGNPVDRGFVEEQRSAIGVVAETIRDLSGRGVPVTDALGAAQWPYPPEDLRHAVERGYAALPRTPRHLPLV